MNGNSAHSQAQSKDTGGTLTKQLPLVLAGPILRHVSSQQFVLWLVASKPLSLRLRLTNREQALLDRTLGSEQRCLRVGTQAYIYLVDVRLHDPLPSDTLISYDLGTRAEKGDARQWIQDWAPHLCLPGATCPDFVLKSRLDRVLHGSCRRPHHRAADGLTRIDRELQEAGRDPAKRPALLLMTGDQIYADDVAGPMLRAIHAVIETLGLFDEALHANLVSDSRALRSDPHTYYRRQDLLPANKANEALIERFLGGVRKPIFTAANAKNHLISLNEVLAIYLLMWSPLPWQLIEISEPQLNADDAKRFRQERVCIEAFVASLPQAARAMANVPCYMIFDDHDVTDDWNLSAQWEATAYEHPFSKRIIGDALIAYLLCQGWGNAPQYFDELVPAIGSLLDSVEEGGLTDDSKHKAVIDALLEFPNWGYELPTSPPVLVLDTRTRRWRSELSMSRPSGLMDWEALMEFQQDLLGKETVIVVSPTPMFGVKLIEIIQRIFTFFGRALLVDAENWMAHGGSAYALFNIFRHKETPRNFIILSGDVHYSFAYDLRLRGKPDSPKIWQITSSGIKNEFPKKLLDWLDRLNRWLFASRSPLNWFTKRRRMRIKARLPTGRQAGERLWNEAGIGLVELNEEGIPIAIRQLNATSGGTLFRERD